MKKFVQILCILLCLVMVIGLIPVIANAAETTDHVVIHQAYGGGGNGGALYTYDFIQLYNPTASDVDMSGWSLQYTSKKGSFGENIFTFEGATIKAGGYYLIQMAAGGNAVKDLPTPDATGSFSMGAKEFKLALVKNAEAISGKDDADVIDFLGVGGANEYEGTGSAPQASNSTAAVRKELGVDTDDNAADFQAAAPAPKNSKGETEPPAPEYDIEGLSLVTGTPKHLDEVIIYYPAGSSVISSTASGSKLAVVSAAVEDGKLSTFGEAAVLTVSIDKDGYYTFQCGNQYLTTSETGNSLSLADEASDYSLWTLEAATDGYYIKSVNAVYNENAQYVEYYNGFTTYSFNDSKASIYTFQFYLVSSCEHDWTAATCTEPKTCKLCGAVEGEAPGHQWDAATCTAPKTCSVCKLTEGEALGHNWDTENWTKDKDGHWHACLNSGCTEKSDYAAHTDDGTGACTCGYQNHAHDWNDATCTEPKTCSICKTTEGEALGHKWDDATCTTPKTCSVCKATEGEALGHKWDDATCTTPKTCSVCKVTEGEALGHKWDDATCTTPKTCSVCKATEGDALGHKWNNATCTAPKTCSVCKATEGDALGHKWVDGTCSVCGEAQSSNSAGLITDVSKLQIGDKIIIVSIDEAVAMSTTQNSNNRGCIDVTKTGNTIDLPDGVQILTVEEGTVSGTYALKTEDGKYLYAASASKNYLRTGDKSDNAAWSIKILANGVATVKAQGENTRNWLRYNTGNDIFSCYGSGQLDIAIYKVGYAGDTPGTVTATSATVEEAQKAAADSYLAVKGVVTNVYYSTIYIQDSTGAIKVVLTSNADCKIGDTVVVSGYVSADGLVNGTYEASSGMTLTSTSTTLSGMTSLDVGSYIELPNVTVSEVTTNDEGVITKITVSDGTNTVSTSGALTNSDNTIKAGAVLTIKATIGTAKDSLVLWNSEITVVAQAPAGGDQGEDKDEDKEEDSSNSIVLYNPENGVYVTGTDYLYTSKSGNQKHELETSTSAGDALALTVVENGETVSLVTADGKYLYADGNDVKLVTEAGEYTQFVLETAEGGYYIRCATATYFDKPQYLEIYSGYLTCYSMNESNAGIYTFQMSPATSSPDTGDTVIAVAVSLLVLSGFGITAMVAKKKEF